MHHYALQTIKYKSALRWLEIFPSILGILSGKSDESYLQDKKSRLYFETNDTAIVSMGALGGTGD